MKTKCKFLDVLAMILVIIGALSWGLVGLFHFHLMATIFGEHALAARIIHIVIGLAGLWMIYAGISCCKSSSCSTKSCDK
jgi:uncharacterized protein